jgi:uncharacterized SAM-binding protein YcdF (DUF218 family)
MISRRTFIRGGIMAGVGVSLATYMNGESKYQYYAQDARFAGPDDLAKAQGIVVFTGYKGRIEEALRLCQPNQKLHVSGCGPEMTVPKLLKAFPVKDTKADPANITLDYARSTLENGRMTREWLTKNSDIDRLVIVTSDFHVPRAHSLMLVALQDFDRRVDLTFRPVETSPSLMVSIKERFKLSGDYVQHMVTANPSPSP